MLQMVPLRKLVHVCVYTYYIEVDNRRKKEKERKERITTIASQMNDTKMKKIQKTHVALKLVEYGAKNIQSQSVCSRHPSHKCS